MFENMPNENRNECEICEKVFNSRCHLDAHVQSTHNGIKNFECSNCQKSFSTAQILQRHYERIHEDNKVQCESCEQTFAFKDDL